MKEIGKGKKREGKIGIDGAGKGNEGQIENKKGWKWKEEERDS